jgi:hypothetical protein
VNDIAKGILAGGWSLIAGWILPTAINVLIFGFLILPSLHGVSVFGDLSQASVGERSLAILGAAVVIGLILSALQTPLYRVQEGYLFWPPQLARRSRRRQLEAKNVLAARLDIIRLRTAQARNRSLGPEDKTRLQELEENPRLKRFTQRDKDLTTVQGALLRERLRRYPVDDSQVAPTRLGNAIRRLEEYGYQRYRLDSQALWYELTATAPKQLREQVDLARAGVDFFICLLYGNLFVAVIALVSLGTQHPDYLTLSVTAAVLIILTPLWYRLAVVTTDDWALATRALVDVGRKALAEALALQLPKELSREREMWGRYCRFVRQPYTDPRSVKLDEFRATDQVSPQGALPSTEILEAEQVGRSETTKQ